MPIVTGWLNKVTSSRVGSVTLVVSEWLVSRYISVPPRQGEVGLHADRDVSRNISY